MTATLTRSPDVTRPRGPGKAAPVPPSPVTRFPGGATAELQQAGVGWVSIKIVGDVDGYDKYAIVDELTAYLLRGYLNIQIEAGELTFIDVSALRSFERIRRFVECRGGSLEFRNLRPYQRVIWQALKVGSVSPGPTHPVLLGN